MGGTAFSHGHFSRGRNVKGNGFRESRQFDRKNKAKARRHSFWRYNAERKLQRDIQSAQRKLEELNLVAKEMKEMGNLYAVYEDSIDLQEQIAIQEVHSNETPSVDAWVSEQTDIARSNSAAEFEPQTVEELYTPATTSTESSNSLPALYTTPITPPQYREPSPVLRPADNSNTFDNDFILFDEGTGSEIDFDNMSDADPAAFPPLF